MKKWTTQKSHMHLKLTYYIVYINTNVQGKEMEYNLTRKTFHYVD